MLANKFACLVSRLLPRISDLIGLNLIPCGKKIQHSQPHPGLNDYLARIAFPDPWPQGPHFEKGYRLGRTLLGRAETTRPISILSRCQLPRPNCQRSNAEAGGGKPASSPKSLADRRLAPSASETWKVS